MTGGLIPAGRPTDPVCVDAESLGGVDDAVGSGEQAATADDRPPRAGGERGGGHDAPRGEVAANVPLALAPQGGVQPQADEGRRHGYKSKAASPQVQTSDLIGGRVLGLGPAF